MQTPKISEGVINLSPPNGHARQQDMEYATANEDKYAKETITMDSTGLVAQNNKQDRRLDLVADVDHHHSKLEHAFDSIGEDVEDIDVARFLHSFGDDDDYEYEIDIEKTEYKFT